jgi:cytoskeleton protein RodZ
MNPGLQLRNAREHRCLSLRDVSNVTKVPIGALEAIELNKIDRLPRGIFTRGFVRAYAAAVGLDPHATVDEFLAQFDEEPATESTDQHGEAADVEPPANRIPMLGSLALAGFLLVYSAYIASTDTSAKSPATTLLPSTPTLALGTQGILAPSTSTPTAIAIVAAQSRNVRAAVRSERAISSAPQAKPTSEGEIARDATGGPPAVADPGPPEAVPAIEPSPIAPLPIEPDPDRR